MAYGNEVGLVIVDIVQKCCLLNIGTPDLYGNADPYQRVPRSPKRNPLCEGEGERCRSPSIDQVSVLVVSCSLCSNLIPNCKKAG